LGERDSGRLDVVFGGDVKPRGRDLVDVLLLDEIK
jgi:hypothetical protein